MSASELSQDYYDRWVRPYVAVILTAAFVWGFIVEKVSQEFFTATYSVIVGFYFAQRAAQIAQTQAQQAAVTTAATTAAAVLASTTGNGGTHLPPTDATAEAGKPANKEPMP